MRYPPYLVSNSDIGENLLIPVFRWARTHQETRQRSRRLKERSTVSSELKLFWQWPLVKVIDTDTSGTWDWKALDAEKGSCDVIFRGWSRLKNLEPLILDLDWKSDTRVLKNDITISLTLQLFWAYLDPSSCSNLVYILLSLYHLYSIPFSCMFSVYPRKCTSDVWSIYTLYLLSYSSYLSTYAAILKYLLVTTFKDIWAWELYISPACFVRALLIWKQTNYYILRKCVPIGC